MGLRHALPLTLIVLAYASPSAQRMSNTPSVVSPVRPCVHAWNQADTTVVGEELDRYAVSYADFVLVASEPHSGPAREARQRDTAQPAKGSAGYQGQSPWLVVRSVLQAIAIRAPGDDKPTPEEALALAQRYLAGWEETLVALVAEEQYQQERKLARSFVGGWMPGTKRRLKSEVLLLQVPVDQTWLSFRDVMTVDGRAVHDRKFRFDELFSGGAASILSTLQRIADEGARYNLGRLHRTINTPTAALVFLKARYATSTDWTLEPRARLNDRPSWILRFNQQRAPFAVTGQSGTPLPASGRFWLEPGTGRIQQSELQVKGGRTKSTVRVRYGPARAIDAWVPLRRDDGYETDGETVSGSAIYSNHRLFRTTVRIIGAVPS